MRVWDRDRWITTFTAFAHRRLRRADEPDSGSGPTRGTGPHLVQPRDPLQRGVNFGCCRFPLAGVRLYVESCLNVGFQIRKKRLQILQHLFGVLIEPPTRPGEEFADFSPIVAGAAAEG